MKYSIITSKQSNLFCFDEFRPTLCNIHGDQKHNKHNRKFISMIKYDLHLFLINANLSLSIWLRFKYILCYIYTSWLIICIWFFFCTKIQFIELNVFINKDVRGAYLILICIINRNHTRRRGFCGFAYICIWIINHKS